MRLHPSSNWTPHPRPDRLFRLSACRDPWEKAPQPKAHSGIENVGRW